MGSWGRISWKMAHPPTHSSWVGVTWEALEAGATVREAIADSSSGKKSEKKKQNKLQQNAGLRKSEVDGVKSGNGGTQRALLNSSSFGEVCSN